MKKSSSMKVLLAGALSVGSLASCTKNDTGVVPRDSANTHQELAGKIKGQMRFTPPLTPLGANIAQYGAPERRRMAERLLQGFENVQTYNTGICYEVVAFVRFLFDNAITCDDLTMFRAQGWLDRFQFNMGPQWDGVTPLPAGTVLGFRNEATQEFFHAAIATGDGDQIRSVNGGRLGAGWNAPVRLRAVLGNRNMFGTFNYDGSTIRVFISNFDGAHQEL